MRLRGRPTTRHSRENGNPLSFVPDSTAPDSNRYLVICLKNKGYEASLERRKIYFAIADESAMKHQLVRIIDESGDDYLFPDQCFAKVNLPASVKRAMFA